MRDLPAALVGRAPHAHHSFIHPDDSHDHFEPGDEAGMRTWWNGRWSALLSMDGESLALVRQDPVPLRVAGSAIVTSRISMCIVGRGGLTPLSAADARHVFYNDPDTGRPLPPQEGLVFGDFDAGPMATKRSPA